MSDRTEWYPSDVEPIHVGVYERLYPSGTARFCAWTGKFWTQFADTAEEALCRPRSYRELPWRGLLEAHS